MNFRSSTSVRFGISLDETTTERDLVDIWRVFNGDRAPDFTAGELLAEAEAELSSPARAHQRLPDSTRSSTGITPRPRCCATSSAWNRATSR